MKKLKKTMLLMVLSLAACDKPKSDASTTTTTTTTASTTPTANQIVTAADPAVPTPVPTASTAASAWPLPDYPGATVTKKTSDLVSLETKDAPAKVVAFYKDKLTAAGFPPGAWASLGAKADQATVMTASKGSQMVQITITPVQGTTKISVSSI